MQEDEDGASGGGKGENDDGSCHIKCGKFHGRKLSQCEKFMKLSIHKKHDLKFPVAIWAEHCKNTSNQDLFEEFRKMVLQTSWSKNIKLSCFFT